MVREAGWRAVQMRHFDVQLIGGMVLHQGKISEMKTGEGKTLVATLACYLNALAGHGVHVVTVNDYLAKRDAEWMGKIYEFLGLTVGVIVHDLDDNERRAAYAADITYGTNNEFGFDYLRDNMKFEIKDCVQRGHYYAIVDEVDSILIDEARTPLIISGPTDQTTDKYARVRRIIPATANWAKRSSGPTPSARQSWACELGEDEKHLTGDYIVDEKQRTIGVTDEGWETIEKALGIGNIADAENWELKHYVETAIKAHALYKRDVDYVVKDGEVIIVDTFTGRLMPGRRWSDGLHQSIEAKEGVNIRKEDQTLATITFQNYFRLYQKLSGMTGTAETEAAEFEKIYKLEIVVIPTNKPMLRLENPDVVFRTEKEKYKAVADNIAELHEKGQPVLVGTTSIEKSERLSAILQQKGVRHVVLNAKFHEREAEIVAQAGRLGMVTISTNMAGRGTDILLGGNPDFMTRKELVDKKKARAISVAEGAINPMAPPGFQRFYYQGQEFEISDAEWAETNVVHAAAAQKDHEAVIAAGGLFILGTERHESRRIDNQLRGRAGRQGDPGEIALLSFARRRPDAHLRQAVGEHAAGAAGHGRGRAHRVAHDFEAHRGRAEGRGGAELRSAQTPARVRRRDEQAARGGVRPAPATARGRRAARADSGRLRRRGFVEPARRVLQRARTRPDQWDLKGLGEKLVDHFGFNLAASGIKPEELSRHELGEAIFAKLTESYEAKEKILGAGDHALPRAHGDAERDRRAVEGSPALDGPPEGGHQSARLCAEGSAGGVQARILRDVRSHDAEVPGRHGAVPLPDADSGARWAARDGGGTAARSGAKGSAGGERGATVGRERRRSARDCDSPAPAFNDHRSDREGIPSQEGAGTGRGQPRGRRRQQRAHAAAHRRQGGTQRSLSLRQREEVQEVTEQRRSRGTREQESE